MDNNYCVYVHRRVSDNLPFYVGKGRLRRAKDRTQRTDWWKRVVEKHGLKIEIVFDSLTEQEAFQVEKDTILEFRYFGCPLVNLTDGGEGASGCKQSEETKRKRAEALRGQKRTPEQCTNISNSLRGRKMTEGQITSMRKSLTGKKRDPEAVLKTAESNRGKTRTEEQKERMRQSYINSVPYRKSQSGNYNGFADKSIYEFMLLETGEILCGTRSDLCQRANLNSKQVARFFSKTKKPVEVVSGWRLLNNATKTEEKTEEH